MGSNHYYNGDSPRYHLEMDDKHQYWLTDLLLERGSVPPPEQRIINVTSITDKLDMGKSGALIYWGIRCGFDWLRDYVSFNGDLSYNSLAAEGHIQKDFEKAHKDEKYKSAKTGTNAHRWIEEYISTSALLVAKPIIPAEAQVVSAITAFLKWEAENKVFWEKSECKCLYVNENYPEKNFCGTFDAVAIVNGTRVLIDFKTSNAYRDEYALQTAAYITAYNKEFSEHGLEAESRLVLMLDKDTQETTAIELPKSRLAMDIKGFWGARAIVEWQESNKAWNKEHKKKKVKSE